MLFKFVFIEIKFTLVLAAMLKGHDCSPLFTKGGVPWVVVLVIFVLPFWSKSTAPVHNTCALFH